jgi:hypothetical protein
MTSLGWWLCAYSYVLGVLTTIAVYRRRQRIGVAVPSPRPGFIKRHIAAIAVALLLVFDVGPTLGVGYLYLQQRTVTDHLSAVTGRLGVVTSQLKTTTGALTAAQKELGRLEARQKAETDCQAAYNQAFALAYAARAAGSVQLTQGIHTFILSLVPVLRHLATPAEVKAIQFAVGNYLRRYNHYANIRQGQPLPPFPNQFCNADNTRGGNR